MRLMIFSVRSTPGQRSISTSERKEVYDQVEECYRNLKRLREAGMSVVKHHSVQSKQFSTMLNILVSIGHSVLYTPKTKIFNP